MIHCLAPAGCCSQMGALPTTTANCQLWTPIAWPTPCCLPLSLLSSPTISPRSVGDSGAAPSPSMVTGMGATARIPMGWMGSSMHPAGQELPSSHLASGTGACEGSPPPASLQTAHRTVIMGWQQSTREKGSHK